jgi:hypothetical protein
MEHSLRAIDNLMRIAASFLLSATLLLGGVPGVRAESADRPAERNEGAARWKTNTIRVALSTQLLRQAQNIKADSDVFGALRRSFRTWESVTDVRFVLILSEKQNVSDAGATGDGTSLISAAATAENALLFAKSPDDTAALTRVFFDTAGFISEADIILNPYQQFSTDGTFGTFDLESTLTHELGHLLGLEHSSVLGSTMHASYAKNGIFGLPSFGPRTLAEIDKAAVRARYGSTIEGEKCCGSVTAKALDASGRAVEGAEVWIEDARTGQLRSQGVTNSAGAFTFEGLSSGTYKVLVQRPRGKTKAAFPVQELGEVTVARGGSEEVSRKLRQGVEDFSVQYLGFNGQLSSLAVPLNAGRSYTVYLGGKNLSAKRSGIRFNSPFLKLVPNTLATHDFGDDLSVISFEVNADPKAPVGEYSIYIDSPAGGRSVIIGGLSVRDFLNPFSNLAFVSE